MACDAGDNEQDPNIGTHSSGISDISVHGKPGRTDLAFIAQQLATSYSTNFDDTGTTLSRKIILMDAASLYVPLFISLKPVGFTLPTSSEANVFLTDYNAAYASLNVSPKMKMYLDSLVTTNNVDYTTLASTINTDLVLTSIEKVQLQFIVTYLGDTYNDPIEDGSWSKKNIVAAMNGFAKSSANAVFNVALVKIIQ